VAVASLAALVLLALIFGPDLSSFSSRFLGDERVDTYGTQWFYWFVGRQLSHGEGFGHTDLFFYPFGKDIYLHTGANVLDAIVAQPFRALLGPVAGYNAFVLVALLANGLCALPLMAQFSESRTARIFGATLYALNPFLLFELLEGRPTQVFQPFLPLFFYHLLRFEREGYRHALWGALHLALTAFTYWFYAIFAGMLAVVHFAQRALLHPRPGRFFGRHAMAAVISLLFVAPAAAPLIASTIGNDTPGLLLEPTWPFLSLKTVTQEGFDIGLSVFQPLMRTNGFLLARTDGSIVYSASGVVITFTQVAMLGLGLTLSRHRWVLGAMLGAALLISVGSLVWLGGPTLPNPIYVLMVKLVPFMRRLWWPGRAMALVGLLAGVLAAEGLGELALRRGPRVAFAVGMAALVGFGLELRALGYAPFPTWSAEIPPGYACLAQGPEGAIIELPYGYSQAHLYYQTAHGRPLLGGMVEDNVVFTPQAQRELREDNSFLRLLVALGADGTTQGTVEEADREAVHQLGYRYVVLNQQAYATSTPSSGNVDPMVGETNGAITRQLISTLGRPVYTDPEISIFAPWGDPSPCGSKGPGRTAWKTRKPGQRSNYTTPLIIRPAPPEG